MLRLHMYSNTAFVFGDIGAFRASDIRLHPALISNVAGQILSIAIGFPAGLAGVSLLEILVLVTNSDCVQGGYGGGFLFDVER